MKRSILILSSLFLVSTLSADWQAIADFEDGIVIRDPNLPADSSPGWEYEGWQYTQNNTAAAPGVLSAVADPTGQLEGLVMESTPGTGGAGSNNNRITLNIPAEMQIVDDLDNPHLQTFYFKMMKPLVDGVPGQMNTTVGLMSRGAWRAANPALLPADPLLPEHYENDLGEGQDPRYETQAPSWGQYSLIARYMTHGSIDLRDAGNYVHLSSAASNVGVPQIANAWYELWFVIDHSNINNEDPFRQRAAVYIKGGPDYPEQTLVSVEYTVAGEGENPDTTYFAGGGANYRVETFEPLDMIIIINNAGNQGSLEQLDPIYMDDFYVDLTGENLSSAGSAPAEYNPFTPPADLADGDEAVSTSGFTLEAINIQAAASTPASHTVNGVEFVGTTVSGTAIMSPKGHIMVTGFTDVADGNGDSAAPFSSASAGMQGILTDAVSGTAYALTLQDLDVGVTYQVQILVNNSGAATGVTTIGSDGFTRDLEVNTTGSAGGMGQTSAFSFEADAVTKSFAITGSSGQVNAVQVRKLTGGIPSDATLVNVSSRATLGASQFLTPGFVVTGSDPKTVLIRAMGPTLADFGVVDFCANPTLTLFDQADSAIPIAINVDWWDVENAQEVENAAIQVGAYALGNGSLDSAILITLDPGVYTAQGTCEITGDVVTEVYTVD